MPDSEGRSTQRIMDKISGILKQAELDAVAHFNSGDILRDAESAAAQVVLSMHGNVPLSALSPTPPWEATNETINTLHLPSPVSSSLVLYPGPISKHIHMSLPARNQIPHILGLLSCRSCTTCMTFPNGGGNQEVAIITQ